MNSSSFGEWLQQEISKRQWSLRNLEEHSGVNISDLSLLVRDKKEPTHRVAEKLAAAFQLDLVFVKRKAGLETGRALSEIDPAALELAQRIDALAISSEQKMRIIRLFQLQLDTYETLSRGDGGSLNLADLRRADPELADRAEQKLREQRNGE